MNVKTRFAPSPTGNLHLGNVRTALYAWLFARNQQGKFVLRIEDTNFKNNVTDDSVSDIISVMQWLNLDWDEGPYFQTDRFDRYNGIINDMIRYRMAYKCYCSEERLELLRFNQIKYKKKPKYDGRCRSILNNTNISKNTPYVVRFSNPTTGKVSFYDQIRGMITFNNQELDDLIIRRANGMPTYNFCVVVDDMDMHITHVIRGEEHINNTPRQINILRKLNSVIPVYAHVPIILDKDHKKLSKSHGTSGILQYRENGFLPEAMLNYLVRLGWSHGNKEIFSIDEMKKYFSFKNISKSASVFDFEKLMWLNRYYINNLPVNTVVSHLSRYVQNCNVNYKNGPKLPDLVRFFAKRVNTLKEIIYNHLYLYEDFDLFDKEIAKKYLVSFMSDPLKTLKKKLCCISEWQLSSIKLIISEIAEELEISLSVIGIPLRIALTGTDKSPELSLVIYCIGKDKVLNRLDKAIFYINQNNS